MDLSFKVEGLDRLDKASKAVAAEIGKQIEIGLYASAKKVEGDAKRSIMQGSKSGRLYQRRTVTHRASAPGEAPANDTGRLVNSINSYLVKAEKYATVTAGRGLAMYARALEFGTAKMAARPFFFAAAEKNRQWISARLSQAVRAAVSKTTKGK
jgi:HK97 gp10 family phage protein